MCSTTGGNTAQGLCDMGGNLWEWNLDRNLSSNDISTLNSRVRMIRGGDWLLDSNWLKSTNSIYRVRTSGFDNQTGFRVLDIIF